MTQAQSKSYGGVKKKLMGAICMLLVASIMVVSSTYAWFTLSTAPEITGISTSVGANGNLEMALLNGLEDGTEETDTYADLDKIKSAVGDSVAATQDAKKSNITWGNLVNLKDGYGLDQIKLMPARLSKAPDSTAEETKVNHTNLLQIASYGADGRVKDVDGLAVSAVKSGENGFQYTADAQTYGVRAIGVASDVTQRQITFNNAKSAVSAAADNAGNPFKTAVSKNFFSLALAAMQEKGDYSDDDITLMTEVATGAKTTLERITNAYAQAAIAAAAAKDGIQDDSNVEKLKTTVTGINSASTLKEGLNTLGVHTYDDALDKIVAAQTSVDNALKALNGGDHTATTLKEEAAKPLIGDSSTIHAYDAEGRKMESLSASNITTAKKIYLTGGVAGTISEFTGNLDLGPNTITQANIIIGVEENTSNCLSDLKTAAERLTAPAGAAVATISDTYGYALDMAFRTNAANSKLQLAGEGVQRVYKDGGNSDTLGKGSTMTFKAEAGLDKAALQKLMTAIRVAFIDPETGKIYGVATLKDMKPGDDGTTGTLTLQDYEFDTDGKLNITEKASASAELMDLPQNTAVRMTVVVWLDGDTVDNSMVANGAMSLTGSMNLQFSSSAKLVPMENSALKNGTGTTGGGAAQP